VTWWRWIILGENGGWSADSASYNSMKNALNAALWAALRQDHLVVSIEVKSTDEIQ